MNEFQMKAEQFEKDFTRLRQEIQKVIVGNDPIIEQVLITLFSGGHCLLECVPGLGKTLLLSTLSRPRREGIVRRLNAEAPGEHIPYPDMLAMIDQYERKGMATGEAGFGVDAEACAALIPAYAVDQPMAIGFVYRPSSSIDVEALQDMLKDAIHHAIEREDNHSVTPLVAAA